MECSRIKTLISLYIDGELEYKTCHEIENHLKICTKCDDSFRSMKNLVNILRSTEKLNAPVDFLNNVHKRIEQSSWKDRLRQILCIPKNIRYPLDIIALGTTAALVLIVFSMFQIQKQENISSPFDNRLSGSELKYSGPLSDMNDELKKSFATLKDQQTETISDIPVQVALFLAQETSGNTFTVREEEDNSDAENRAIPVDNRYLYRVDSFGKGTQQNSQESFSLPGMYQGSNNGVEGILNELLYPLQTEAAHHYFINKAISQIHQNLLIEGGKIISLENVSGTDLPEFVNIQIPGSSYDSFLTKLTGIGSLEISPLSLPAETKTVAQIRIQIIPPQYQ